MLNKISHNTYCSWRNVKESEHFVQFYESDFLLIRSLVSYIGKGLNRGDACMIITTENHKQMLESKLKKLGFPLDTPKMRNLFFSFNASETLSKFMINDKPDPVLFKKTLGDIIVKAQNNTHSNLRVFGEMVATLWGNGNKLAALELENLWNDLAQIYSYSLFCGYSKNLFSETESIALDVVSNAHMRVITSGNPNAFITQDKRLNEMALLQQKAWTCINED